MRIGKVIGQVVLSRSHPTFQGATLKVVQPLDLKHLLATTDEEPEEFIVYDELGAGLGNRIAISEGGEAAQPFYPNLKPVDAYNAAILDSVEIDKRQVNDLNS
jgi:ethanolamine utilization protein EutN